MKPRATDRTPAAGRRGAMDAVATGSLTPAQAAKTLMTLGLLKSGPKHGYELHRIVVAHGSLYADFKKPTLYHLLHRLAMQGSVQVRSEGGARGPRGERLVFALTAAGEKLFFRLLRHTLSAYDAGPTSLEVAAAYLMFLPAGEAQELLRTRREVIHARRAQMAAEITAMAQMSGARGRAARELAADHALSLMDAEIGWTDRAIGQLTAGPRKAPGDAATPRPRLRRAAG
jgi:DNA-binding PadR family transcriptional regulator